MRRLGPPVLIVGIGLVLLADFLVVNPTLGSVAGFLLDLVVLVAAGAALAGVLALGVRHGADLVRRRGSMPASLALLAGMGAMLVAGLRPGSAGPSDPPVRWLVAALLVPLAATLFGLLFVTTLAAVRRAVSAGGRTGREAALMAAAAVIVLVLLLPLGGDVGDGLASASGWALAVPIGAAFRGVLIGVGLVTAVAAARTLLGIGPGDE